MAAAPAPRKLAFGRIALYSMASAGLNILAITIDTWILYFYAPPPDSDRPQYLPVALIGVLMTVASIWDAVVDPFIGHWSDTLRSRWGRRRPFLLLASPFVLAGAILIWTPPSRTVLLTAVYFMTITLMYRTAYSLVGIPYDGTLPEMAPDSRQRVGLSYWKNVFGIIGVLIGSLVAAPLFQSIGAVYMGVVIGVVGVLTIYLTLLGLRETDRPLGEPMKALDGLKATFRNGQFIVVFVSTLFVHICYQMLLLNFPYFVTLVLGKSEADVGIYQGVLILLMALTGPAWMLLNRRRSQRRILNLTMIGLTVVVALGFLVGATDAIPLPVQGFALVTMIGAMLGGYLIIIYAMMGNVVDYDEMLTGRRREAIYYGTFSFAIGLGSSVGALVLPLLLQTFGYTHGNPLGVRAAFLAMALFVLVGYFIFQKYRLGDTPLETRRAMNLPEA
jgi:glycoside/pentoside/hexuronide:cation symporter, GPH family